MKAKSKNPLYVVKEDHVEEATNLFDMLIKKFNLGPLINLIQSLIEMILSSVKNYATLLLANDLIEFVLQKLSMFRRYSII